MDLLRIIHVWIVKMYMDCNGLNLRLSLEMAVVKTTYKFEPSL